MSKQKNLGAMPRVNTKLFHHQVAYIKNLAEKSNGELTEGDVQRQLLEEAITARKGK